MPCSHETGISKPFAINASVAVCSGNTSIRRPVPFTSMVKASSLDVSTFARQNALDVTVRYANLLVRPRS